MAGQGRRRGTSHILGTLLLALLLATVAGAPTASAAISVVDVTVSEASAEASFTVTRTAGLLAPSATVAFSTADGTAVAPADYTALPSGSLFFDPLLLGGVQTQVVKVAIAADALHEPAETFRLVLSGSAEIVDGEGVATILDDDPPPPPPLPPSPPAPPSTPAGEEPAPAGPQAAPDAAPAPVADGPPPSAAIAAAPELGLSSPRLRRPSIMLVTVFCPRSTSRCSGRVTIFSRANPRSRIKALRRERRLGRRNFTLLSGATRTLTIALSRSDRVLLMRTGRMLVRAYAVTRDGNGRSSVRRSSGTLIARTTHS